MIPRADPVVHGVPHPFISLPASPNAWNQNKEPWAMIGCRSRHLTYIAHMILAQFSLDGRVPTVVSDACDWWLLRVEVVNLTAAVT
ncbi:hypothetical protein RRG08_043859 [Elysia crispata]|uniref:Uncharacterized protein n=1 Tax=Elysia crispata TaxID=231223 RepID=A0AAE0XVE9_9GAST|nr:hypothetical protein RRG08_043859 [Elysia crispata]